METNARTVLETISATYDLDVVARRMLAVSGPSAHPEVSDPPTTDRSSNPQSPPVVPLSVSPGGNAPLTMDQPYGFVPPDAAKVAE